MVAFFISGTSVVENLRLFVIQLFTMLKIVLFVLSMQLSVAGFSQSAIDSVKQVVNSFFIAMNSSDSKALLNNFTDSAVLQTIINRQGKVEVKNESISAFAKSISSLPKGAAEEKITFKTIETDGDLAIAWTPYQFFFNGKFSHCGVNSFQLVRINGEWKIQSIIDTRRKSNCQ
jgi:ketosteroid isomerase-like protein